MSFDLSFQRSFDASFRLSFEASDERSDALSFEVSDARSDEASSEMSDGRSYEVSSRVCFLRCFPANSETSILGSFPASFQTKLRFPSDERRLAASHRSVNLRHRRDLRMATASLALPGTDIGVGLSGLRQTLHRKGTKRVRTEVGSVCLVFLVSLWFNVGFGGPALP
jgi:hypothetical protein